MAYPVPQPQALKKHDGRIVAFERSKIADAIARAALTSGDARVYDEARLWSDPLAAQISSRVMKECKGTPASADVRATTIKVLRETGHAAVAESFVEQARAAASFLWRLRIYEGPMRPHGAGGGNVRKPGSPVLDKAMQGGVDFESAPWDRRRLMEVLRVSGLARDPAGEVARAVERKLIQLEEEWVSAALVHALAVEEINRRGSDSRPYMLRRVPVSFVRDASRPVSETLHESQENALESFWRETVHSAEVTSAARHSLLNLAPFPADCLDIVSPLGWAESFDPCQEQAYESFSKWRLGDLGGPLQHPEAAWIKLDSPERSVALANLLTGAGECERLARREIRLCLRQPGERSYARPKRCAPPITLNLAGLLVRSGLRDPLKATRKVAHLAALAAQAHREREEFWGLSPVRGRELPLLASGFWNAAAWLCNESFERPPFTASLRVEAATLSSVIYGAVATLRAETGLNLSVWSPALPLYWKHPGAAPESVAGGLRLTELWRRDGEYFARDGARLDEHGSYGVGLELTPFGLPGLKTAGSDPELQQVSGERVLETLEYLAAVAPNFDEPPPLVIEVPLGVETDALAWRELFSALVESKLPVARLVPGGGKRSLKIVARMIRHQAEGFPLFEGERL
jgi:hypothetical protein